jgi:glutamate carboxypeptidase
MAAMEPTEESFSTMLDQLAALVAVESPSHDLAATARCADAAAEIGSGLLGRSPERVRVDGRVHLLWPAAPVDVLVLGHVDTVWPVGTLARWPFSVADGRATGPGVFDMKAGLVQAFHALAGIDTERVAVLLTSDEEIGSPTSRPLIEETARDARATLVAEPSAAGALKAQRAGVSQYLLTVTGRAAHAGLDPHRGVNALLAAARLALEVTAFADAAAGTTVTPTRLHAGTTVNTVPDRATLDVDVRAGTPAEQERVDAAFRAAVADAGGSAARVELAGGPNRPPLPAELSADLVALAARIAAAEGIALPPPVAVGGGSDGNFTAGIGVPTLDGLGAVGGNAHAEGEWVDVAAMRERAVLLRRLVVELLR